MAFSKKAVEDRKTWLSNFVPGTFLDSDAAKITYSDFVHKVCSRQNWSSSLPQPHVQQY
jgi:DNA topoisomerase II